MIYINGFWVSVILLFVVTAIVLGLWLFLQLGRRRQRQQQQQAQAAMTNFYPTSFGYHQQYPQMQSPSPVFPPPPPITPVVDVQGFPYPTLPSSNVPGHMTHKV
ncbi:hypothetical protein KP509_23G082600 [Ceratopteris richardii]|uniref:Uncharacterized protein n=1 Tax=Ceratopteris richardii TaxID=49495 RepID=A0A8T2S479_CERRI|nr:hypothetical protein KP509_23G082600 [Ceratopteris richardii]